MKKKNLRQHSRFRETSSYEHSRSPRDFLETLLLLELLKAQTNHERNLSLIEN